MTGVSEILVLVLLIACILILPRLFKGEPSVKNSASAKALSKLTAATRSGIVLSIVYPVGMALVLKPWQGNVVRYISIGVIPVLLVWAVVWILAGRKK